LTHAPPPCPSRCRPTAHCAVGHHREPCFFDEQDYHAYLQWLSEALARERCALHAYVLMTKPRPFADHARKPRIDSAGHYRRGAPVRAIHQPHLPASRSWRTKVTV
jgi:hypothetical protein